MKGRGLVVLLFLFVSQICASHAQSTTTINITLNRTDEGTLKVRAYPPENVPGSDWTFIIPNIVPGTYMKLKYHRFYNNLKAFDHSGNPLKVRKKKNHVFVPGPKDNLDYIEYEITESVGDGPIWDEVIGCAGTIFTENSYLLNFQLVNGYFDGFKDTEFVLELEKNPEDSLFGAGGLEVISRTPKADILKASNYSELIDNPMLYAKPDTSSFIVGQNKFHVAIHSEKGSTPVGLVAESIRKQMEKIKDFSGFTDPQDYYFILYYISEDHFKKNLGLSSALEHKHSSVYFYRDTPNYDSLFRNLNNITAHEYFHTFAPLNIHSNKIHNFNFDKPDMSDHGWLYEGSTDYLAALVNATNDDGIQRFMNALASAKRYSEKRVNKPIAESSKKIIKKNNLQWIFKMLQLINFYERGKIISFAMDMELFRQTNGEKRLVGVLNELRANYRNTALTDDELMEKLVAHSFPEMQDLLDKYVYANESVNLEQYLSQLGYTYFPKGTKVPAYATKMSVWFNFDQMRFRINKIKKNTLGLQDGDFIMAINGQEITRDTPDYTRYLGKLYNPETNDSPIELEILRGGEKLTLKGISSLNRKVKRPVIVENPAASEKQLENRRRFFGN